MRSIPPGQKRPGFSFVLHLLRVQGFCFVLRQCSHAKAFTACFAPSMQLYHTRRKTAHRALQVLSRLSAMFCCCCMAGASDYAAPPALRWSAHTRSNAPHRYQIPPPRRTLYRSAQPPYYNKVYKGAAVRPCYGSMTDSAAYHRPCQPGGVSVSTCTGSARRRSGTGSVVRVHRVGLAPSTRRNSPAAEARRAARNH